MSPYEDRIEQLFSLKHFLVGLGVVAALYVLLAAYALLTYQGPRAPSGEPVFPLYTVEVERFKLEKEAHTQEPPISAHTQEHMAEPPELNAQDMSNALPPNTAKSLSAAPAPGLSMESAFGLLPLAQGSKTPFNVYKKPALVNRDKPMLAIAVRNYGLSNTLSETMLKTLPPEVSFILNPYTEAPDLWQQKARADGHEIWLQIFTATHRFPAQDPGAKGLLPSGSLKYNQDRLHWALGRTTGYAGIAAFTDSTLESAAPVFQSLAQDIFRRGLGYLELNPGRDSFIAPLAINENVPNTQSVFTIEAQGASLTDIGKIEKHIRDHGGALITLTPTPKNIEFVKNWIAGLSERNINIVPVSALAAMGRNE
ncbi:MAG: divergent polysaccharide deacetylase family protein [Alphaproteobacteria bacterium]|nr:divergent polysaccharide deacetylase family protein [Alphaproteobacteria bacterium]